MTDQQHQLEVEGDDEYAIYYADGMRCCDSQTTCSVHHNAHAARDDKSSPTPLGEVTGPGATAGPTPRASEDAASVPSSTYWIIATRDKTGQLNPDWDGVLHTNRDEAEGELRDARADWDDTEAAMNYAVLMECRRVEA